MVGKLNSAVSVTSDKGRYQVAQQTIYTDYHKTIITDNIYRLTGFR